MKQLVVKVPDDLHQWLKDDAATELTDVSAVVRSLILNYKRSKEAREARPAINVVDFMTDASCTTTLELDE